MPTPSPTLLDHKRTPTPALPLREPTKVDVFTYVKSAYAPRLDAETQKWLFRKQGYPVTWAEVVADLLVRYPKLVSRREHPFAYIIARLYSEFDKASR